MPDDKPKDDEAIDPELKPVVYAVAPTISMDDEAVEFTEFSYSERAKDDWVISGPLGDSCYGRGRFFETWADAEKWAREYYGWRFRCRKPDEPGSLGRWAFLIRGPRGTNGKEN